MGEEKEKKQLRETVAKMRRAYYRLLSIGGAPESSANKKHYPRICTIRLEGRDEVPTIELPLLCPSTYTH